MGYVIFTKTNTNTAKLSKKIILNKQGKKDQTGGFDALVNIDDA